MIVINKNILQFLRYATVGLLNTAIDIGILNLLLFWSWSVIPANTVAFLIASVNSFFFNKYWTFGDTEGKWQAQLPKYIFVVAVGVGISDLVIYLLAVLNGWDVNIVKVLSIVATVAWNFLAPKLLIFKK